MYKFLRLYLFILSFCAMTPAVMANDDIKKFENRIYLRTTDLLHNHTYDKANLTVADSIYKVSKARGSHYGMLCACRLRMFVYVSIPDSAKLVATTDEAISLSEQINDNEFYTEAMNVKISFYVGQEHFMKALQLTEELMTRSDGSSWMLSQCYSTMANIYQNRDIQQMSIKYYEKSLEYADMKDTINVCLTYRNLAECYSLMEDHTKALEYAKKALSLSGTTGVYYFWSAFTYLYSLFEKGDYKVFLSEYNRIRLLEQPVEGLLPDYIQHQLLLRHELALGNYDEAMKQAEAIEFKNLRLPALILVYRMSGNWAKTVEYLDIYNNYQDSVRSQMAMDDMLEVDAQMGLNRLKIEKKELEARNQLITFGAIIAIILIVAIGLAYMLVRRRAHVRELNKKNEELREKNHQLFTKNEELIEARDEAERSSQMKTHFMQNMNHEIRTPLNIISGFSQVLASDIEPEERQQYVQTIVDNTTTVTTILSDMLLLSDLDSGTYALKMAESSAVTHQLAINDQGRVAVHDGVTFESPVELDESVHIHADATLLYAVFTKLISNSAKFTKSGSVVFRCQLTPENHVQYSITDTGCGIPEDKVDFIFDRFFKVDEFVPGVGIGLTICKEAVELMGGSIWLDTEYTGGSRFVIDFPCID